MSKINLGPIYGAIRQVIADYIGSDLSQIGGKPSIIKAREKGAKAKYPFATMDIINISDKAGYLTNKKLNDLGQDVYETHKEIVVLLSVRSTDSDQSYELTEYVSRAFSFQPTLSYLYDTVEATVTSTSPLRAQTEVLSDRLQTYNSFTVTLGINSTYTDVNSAPIEHIETEGSATSPDGSTTDTSTTTP